LQLTRNVETLPLSRDYMMDGERQLSSLGLSAPLGVPSFMSQQQEHSAIGRASR